MVDEKSIHIPFVMVSHKLARDRKLTATDKSIALVLCSYRNNETYEAIVKRRTLVEVAGVSDRTLTRSIKRLEEAGYIEVIEQYKKDKSGNFTGERACNIYRIKNV